MEARTTSTERRKGPYYYSCLWLASLIGVCALLHVTSSRKHQLQTHHLMDTVPEPMVNQIHLFVISVDVPGRRTRRQAAAETVSAAILLSSLPGPPLSLSVKRPGRGQEPS